MAMIAKDNSGNFEPCPEYTGRAVCVDVTPLKKVNGPFGEQEKFRFAFEIDDVREDGSPWCVWSSGFTLSLNEKANLRKFLKSWLGRDLTQEELKNGFDVESMLHRPAFLVVVHEHKDGQTYSNIASCTPHRTGDALAPSGQFKRAVDRAGGQTNSGSTASSRDQSYKRTSTPPTPASPENQTPRGDSYLETRVHVGRHAGQELRELSEEAIGKLVEHWLPAAQAATKTTADDKRLIAALDWYVQQKTGSAIPVPVGDDCPF